MFLLFYYKDLPASSKHVLKEDSAALRVLHSYKALKGSIFFDSSKSDEVGEVVSLRFDAWTAAVGVSSQADIGVRRAGFYK
jgi:hypothetical protein